MTPQQSLLASIFHKAYKKRVGSRKNLPFSQPMAEELIIALSSYLAKRGYAL